MLKINKTIFLDYASTTPTDKIVLKTMMPFWHDVFANPSSIHVFGLKAKKALEDSRNIVAKIAQTKSNEVTFCSSGTESISLAIIGTSVAILEKIKNNFVSTNKKPHIIVTAIEHVATLESVKYLEKMGFEVTLVYPQKDGIVYADEIEKKLKPETILVSVIFVNNEIGTIMPIREISVLLEKYKKSLSRISVDYPYLHTDASQAPNYLDINLDKLGADIMSLDGSKIYGPKGVGCLLKKNYVPCQNILFGGGQEHGLRPGTESVPLIVGFAKALELANKNYLKESKRMQKLQDYFFKSIKKELPETKINGSLKKRIPNNVSLCLAGINAEFATIYLDKEGIACSATTTCANLKNVFESYVIASFDKDCAKSSIRFSMGKYTKKNDIDRTIKALKKLINKYLLI